MKLNDPGTLLLINSLVKELVYENYKTNKKFLKTDKASLKFLFCGEYKNTVPSVLKISSLKLSNLLKNNDTSSEEETASLG
jgi:hypothetical protein